MSEQKIESLRNSNNTSAAVRITPKRKQPPKIQGRQQLFSVFRLCFVLELLGLFFWTLQFVIQQGESNFSHHPNGNNNYNTNRQKGIWMTPFFLLKQQRNQQIFLNAVRSSSSSVTTTISKALWNRLSQPSNYVFVNGFPIRQSCSATAAAKLSLLSSSTFHMTARTNNANTRSSFISTIIGTNNNQAIVSPTRARAVETTGTRTTSSLSMIVPGWTPNVQRNIHNNNNACCSKNIDYYCSRKRSFPHRYQVQKRFDSSLNNMNINNDAIDDTRTTVNSNIDNDSNVPIIIDGKAVAATIRNEIKENIMQYYNTNQTTTTTNNNDNVQQVPGLAVVLVGNRPDSVAYVTMKQKACTEVGMHSIKYVYNETVTTEELCHLIHVLNNDTTIQGILVQLPLPIHIQQENVLNTIDPTKDVDGLHPVNVAALQLYRSSNRNNDNGISMYKNVPFHIPCTPLGCLELLDRYNISVYGKNVVVVGRSILVGLPMIRLLLGRDATVSCVHSHTVQPERIMEQADIIIAAVGKPYLIKGSWIKQGAVVIDVGINSIENPFYNPNMTEATVKSNTPTTKNNNKSNKKYVLVGDVNYEEALQKCSYITPVPGGVGPMTIAMLLQNTYNSFVRQNQRNKKNHNDKAPK